MNENLKKMYDDIHNNAIVSLNTTVCNLCKGFGHVTGLCATLKNLDRIMKAQIPEIRDIWIMEKKNKINSVYHDAKKIRAGNVHKRLMKKKKLAELELSQLEERFAEK